MGIWKHAAYAAALEKGTGGSSRNNYLIERAVRAENERDEWKKGAITAARERDDLKTKLAEAENRIRQLERVIAQVRE